MKNLDYSKTIKTAGFMAVTTILAKVLGLVRDMILAAVYATGPQATAFTAATEVPLRLFDVVIGGVITAAFIPIYNSVLTKENKEKAMKFANDYVNGVLVVTLLLTFFGLLFNRWLIGFIAPGIDAPTTELAISLSRIMFGMIIFTGLTYVFVGILNSNGEFYITSMLSVVFNIILIVYFIFFIKRGGILGLAITWVIAWAAQAFIQAPYLKKFQFKYKPTLQLNTPEMKMAIKLAVPILISSWAPPVASLVNLRMSSYLNGGKAFTALSYSNKLYIVITGVFAFVASNLSFPYLAKAEASGRKDEIKKMRGLLLIIITFIMAPIMVGLILLALPIVRLAFERGNFTAADSALTATALMGCSFGMLAHSYNEILNKIFYALRNSKTPMYTAMIGMGVNIVGSVILSRYMGIIGLGFAIALGYMITAILNLIWMSKELGDFGQRQEFIDLGKIALAVTLMGGAVFAIRGLFEGAPLGVLVPTGVGIVVYFVSCILLKVSAVWQFIDFVQAKLKRGEINGK